MAYKKYIKKNGKIYGPYIYHSKRVDGKVVTEYKGPSSGPGLDSKKILPFLGIFIAILVLAFAMYVFINPDNRGLTGFSVLDLNANYQPGENLQGKLDVTLKEGELIPATSDIVFETQDNTYQYTLRDILSENENLVQGDFYVEGSNLSGEGIGYGFSGEKVIYPNVSFILLINTPSENNTLIETEVNGNVSANNTFEYTLQENQMAEIKSLSVSSEGESLSQDVLDMEILNNTLIISTNYSSLEEGFGEEYGGNSTRDISIDLSSLNLSLNEGNLSVRLEYLGNDLVSLNTNIEAGEVSAEAPKNTSQTSETNQLPIEEENIDIQEFSQLTQQERNALENEFGNITLEATEAFTNNGFITVRYQLGDYWVEHSYSSDLDNQTLRNLMEEDRVKWLKDIASNLLNGESSETSLANLTGTYDF